MYPKNHGKLWTVDDMWLLAELYTQPITWDSIARKLKRTVNACQARMYLIRLAWIFANGKSGQTIMDSLTRTSETSLEEK